MRFVGERGRAFDGVTQLGREGYCFPRRGTTGYSFRTTSAISTGTPSPVVADTFNTPAGGSHAHGWSHLFITEISRPAKSWGAHTGVGSVASVTHTTTSAVVSSRSAS